MVCCCSVVQFNVLLIPPVASLFILLSPRACLLQRSHLYLCACGLLRNLLFGPHHTFVYCGIISPCPSTGPFMSASNPVHSKYHVCCLILSRMNQEGTCMEFVVSQNAFCNNEWHCVLPSSGVCSPESYLTSPNLGHLLLRKAPCLVTKCRFRLD